MVLAQKQKHILTEQNGEPINKPLHIWYQFSAKMSRTYNGERIISSINGVRKPGNSVWWFFTKLKIELPYNSPTPLLGIYSKETKIGYRRNICILCSLQHYPPESRYGNNLSAHQWMNGLKQKCGEYIYTHTQWNFIQTQKRKYCHLQ